VIATRHSSSYLEQQLAWTLEIETPDPRDPLVTIIGADAREREHERRRIDGVWRTAAIGSAS
jgi:hypothetical protein